MSVPSKAAVWTVPVRVLFSPQSVVVCIRGKIKQKQKTFIRAGKKKQQNVIL
jgi:hypothetical protein